MREGDQIVPARPTQYLPPATQLSASIRRLKKYAREHGAGVAASALLHLLMLLALLFHWRRVLPEQPAVAHFVPVELVAQSQGPASRPAQQRAAGERNPIPRIFRYAPKANHTPTGVAPEKTTPTPDDLEIQLKALSKLRQPNTDPRLAGDAGTADLPESGNDNISGGEGAYQSNDIIRAQVLRRWNLDMGRLGNRNFTILIHVLLKRDGTVLKADIVDKQRYATDSAFRWIALSARNAILLSSPLTLPSGLGDESLDMTLKLNPRDTLQ
jgi:hypothetical protein